MEEIRKEINETDISTPQQTKKKSSWISIQNENRQRPEDFKK